MRLKNIVTNIALAALCVAPMSSCSDWLEVDMEDGIMENTLFKDNEGFLVALNGIYTNLNNVYSSFLSMGAIDVMAQYYNVQQNSQHPYYVYANYNYTDDTFDQASGSLWTNMYTLIANTNLLLDHCDEEGSAISPRYYDMVKGEALALRAMMHFDMLRLYGPIYSESTASQSAVPYLETANNREMLPVLSAGEVAQKVMRDLTEASSLLQNDSIRTAGVNSSESEDINENNDFRYRQYRLNYFAVQTLLARLYLWMGNKSEAYRVAKAVIDEVEEKETFPWVTAAMATNASYPDRVFSTEVIFGLYNTSRLSLYDDLFNSDLEGSALTFVGDISSSENSKVSAFYGEGSNMDYRRRMWETVTSEVASDEGGTGASTASSSYFLKYDDITPSSSYDIDYSYRYLIPLMRMSEVYLIAAECTDDLTEATEYINDIRLHRNVANVTPTATDLQDYITREFAREVIGEGQLFFYYKRHAMTTIQSGTAANATVNMALDDYVVPLPTTETDNRQ